MITQDQVQNILDHFHVGKLKSLEQHDFFYEAKTNRGTFFILFDEVFKARDTEEVRQKKLSDQKGKIKRILLPDFKGEIQDYSSYAHKGDSYYSVYQLENNQ
jgi:hypothetical protein